MKRKTVILLLLALAQLLVVLDSAIVNVALPAIKTALHFDTASLQWVITAYVLTFGGFLMLGGRLADLYGRRRVLAIGIGGFTAVSFLLGVVPSSIGFVALRSLQGLAGALMAPAALSILMTTFAEGDERNRALSVWSVVASGGAAVGVFLGGVLTQYLGWRWCFFVNVPIGILTLIGVLRYLPAHFQEESDKHLDIPGAILVTAGLMALVFGLTRAPSAGWASSAVYGPLALSVVLLAAFLFNEAKVKHPLVPLSIFRLRNVNGGNLIMLPVVAGAFGLFFFVSLFIQNVLRYPPALSGVSFLPIPIIIGIISTQAPHLIKRFGFKPLMVAGLTMVAIGTFLLSFLTAHANYWLHLLPAFVLMGIGFGISFVSVTIAATSGVPDEESGLAAGLVNTSQQIGGALGIAILAVVASGQIRRDLAAGQDAVLSNVDGYQQAFVWATAMIVAALLVAIYVIQTPPELEPATEPETEAAVEPTSN